MQININGHQCHHDDDSEVEDDREDGAVDETPCFDNKFFFTYYWAGGGEKFDFDRSVVAQQQPRNDGTNEQATREIDWGVNLSWATHLSAFASIVFYMKFPHKAEDRTISLKAGAWSTPAVITFLQSHLWWPRERAAKWSRRWNELVTLPSLLLITTCLTGRWNW